MSTTTATGTTGTGTATATTTTTTTTASPAVPMCLAYRADCADPTKGCDLATSCRITGQTDSLQYKRFADSATGAARLCVLQDAGVPGSQSLFGQTDDSAQICSLEATGFLDATPTTNLCPTGTVPIMMDSGANAGKIMCMTAYPLAAAPAAPSVPATPAAPAAPAAPTAPTTTTTPAAPAAPATQTAAELAAQRTREREAAVAAAREEAARRLAEADLQAEKRLQEERATLQRMGMSSSAPSTVAQVLGRKPAMRPDMPDESVVQYPPFGRVTDSTDERLRLTQFALASVATSGLL